MEKQSYLLKEPEREFYVIKYGNKNHIVSAIGFNGGYVYFLIEGNGDILGHNFQPQITPISDILCYCKPDAEVISIEPKNPDSKKLYEKLCLYMDEFKSLKQEATKD